jgi:hypothetical protein
MSGVKMVTRSHHVNRGVFQVPKKEIILAIAPSIYIYLMSTVGKCQRHNIFSILSYIQSTRRSLIKRVSIYAFEQIDGSRTLSTNTIGPNEDVVAQSSHLNAKTSVRNRMGIDKLVEYLAGRPVE